MDNLQSYRLHFDDRRSKREIELTDSLTHALTDLNLQRIAGLQKSENVGEGNGSRKNYLYVCFTGLPPLAGQFDGLGIPGERMIVYPAGFEPGLTEQQIKQSLNYSQIELQVARIHQLLQGRTDKPLVFIYHSFGTTLMSALFRLYYSIYSQRVIGFVGIGTYPIRSGNLAPFLNSAESYTLPFMLENVDKLYEEHLESSRKLKFAKTYNKYANIACLIAFGHGMGFTQMFDYNRRWPAILKCFIHGRQDNRIDQNLLNQTAVYYSYKRKFSSDYQSRLKSIYRARYGVSVGNLQERFIFNIAGGKHSLHIQKRLQPVLREILQDYLSVIELMHPC